MSNPAPTDRAAALAEHLRSISAIADTTGVPVEQRAQLVADSARRTVRLGSVEVVE